MAPKHEDRQAEELSRGIDALNCGQQPDCRDEEVRELIAVAGIIKYSSAQSGPMPPGIEKLADTIAADIANAQRRRRNRRIVSGCMGTAAAILIAVILNYYSLPENRHLAGLEPPGAGHIAGGAPAAPAPGALAEPEADKPGGRQLAGRKADAQSSTGQNNGGNSRAQKKTGETASRPVTLPSPGLTAVPDDNGGSAGNTPASAKEPQVAIAFLPGRTANSVIVDKESGLVRQVYDAGTKQQIVVTQKPRRQAVSAGSHPPAVAAKPAEQADRPAAAGASRMKTNRVTVNTADSEITVEGEQSEEELNTLAKSLADKK